MRITQDTLEAKTAILNNVTGMTFRVNYRNGYTALDLMNGSAIRKTIACGLTKKECALVMDCIIDSFCMKEVTA